LVHSYEDDLSFLYGAIFLEALENTQVDSCNVCVFVDGQLDRNLTDFRVSAQLAIHHALNGFKENPWVTIEGLR